MVGLTLALDASAGPGTVAVLNGAAVVAERTVVMRSEDEERFLPAVLDTLREAGAGVGDLDRIVCGGGPGSFTALRVVGACAKGLAFGANLSLFAVPSLALIVAADDATRSPGTKWLATLDAMRGDRYLALVSVGAAGAIESVQALGLARSSEIVARAVALSATAIGIAEAHEAAPHARGVARCLALIDAAGAVPLASWEPVYGRLAEAQVKWEAARGRPLGA